MLNILLVIIILVILVNVLFSLKENFQSNQYQPFIEYTSNIDNNLVAYEIKYIKGDKGDQGDKGVDASALKYVNYFQLLIPT
tara:strand:- start:1375 stop:1620 length:246 start_codon:yes stop_codon:yes gene_type:complete